jgi:hypothetical protein
VDVALSLSFQGIQMNTMSAVCLHCLHPIFRMVSPRLSYPCYPFLTSTILHAGQVSTRVNLAGGSCTRP